MQMIRQDAVFDRAEQRRNAAEAEQRQKQQIDRIEGEAGRGDQLHADVCDLQNAGRTRPCRARRRFRRRSTTAESKGSTKIATASEILAPASASPKPEQDQHRQHLANEIVVEGGKELTPEQRRESPRRHQVRKHAPRAPATPGASAPRLRGTMGHGLSEMVAGFEEGLQALVRPVGGLLQAAVGHVASWKLLSPLAVIHQ